ncbi:hypothetical protein Tco_0821122 [Tanacetum coccineum]|uniref:Uncharacterized protein n=1 Tax=Tanacetum coccineum TaxID=301880 RepID=A0ABQ5AFG6_9ASTR
MMTYLKHVGGKNHSDLKTKNFEEIQVLYEKVKRSDENFIAIGSAKDKRLIKYVNKKATGTKKDDSIKKESKEEESTRKRKLGTRKKIKSRKRRFRQDTSQDDQTDSEKENDKLRLRLTIATDEYKEVDYKILDKKYPIIEWKIEYLGTKPQFDKTKHLEEINQNVVIRSNGQKRYFICVDLSILATTLNRVGRSILNWDLQEVSLERSQDVLIRASGLKKIPYEVMTELIVNAQNKSSISITSNDINIELSKEFLVELHKNAYQGWIDEDMMDQIAKVLVMIDLIYIPSVDSHQLRMIVFPLSLADDAQ